MGEANRPAARRSGRFLRWVALAGVWLGLSIGLVELGLRAWQRIVPPPGGIWESSPTRHHALVPDASIPHRSPEFDCRWHNNALGMRDRERSVQKPPGTYRILFLGDSMVQGHGVALEDTIPARLEALLAQASPGRPVEVLNAGVFAYSPMLEWLYLQEIADTLQPDVVLLGFTLANDVGEDAFYEGQATPDASSHAVHFTTTRWPWERITEILDAKSDGATAPPPGPVQRLGEFLERHSRAFSAIHEATRSPESPAAYYARREREFALVAAHRGDVSMDLGLVNYPVLTREKRLQYWARSKHYLGEIEALCRARGVPLVLVVFPPYERFDGTTSFDEPYQELDATGAALGVPVIQLLGTLSRSSYFPYDRHLRPEGTAAAAGAIARELVRLGLSGAVRAPG